MLPFERILFPVDFSESSLSESTIGAARYVEAFAGRFEAEVTILHVVEFPHYNDLVSDTAEQSRLQLDRYLSKEFPYCRVDRVLAHGDPAGEIVKIARERKSDLLMMPTHGEGAFRRFLLGSVTAKVLHDVDCPVWTGVHLEETPPLEKIEFRRFVCALKRDEYSKTVLAAAKELAEEYSAQLTVLHAAESGAEAAQARQELCEMAPGSYVVVYTGDIPYVIADVAKRTQADLLVIGRSPNPGVLGRLREHSYPIIRRSPCPVISI